MTAIMEDIAPKSPAELFQAMCSSQAIQRTLSSDEETETIVDETLLGALADCYHAAGRLVKQYLAYCEETGFKALSRSTLLRILSVCAASERKSLPGLDYISSSGAEAFDDLCKVAEMLGDAGQGMGWAKQQETNLRESKRYLKSDYKVRFINLFV